MRTPSYVVTAALSVLTLIGYAQNGDCPGEPVCTPQTENMSAGSQNEINAGNRGCLGAAEATSSYWYQLCAAATGTITFTINPQGAGNDYDFAVWGPGSPCPPTTPPIRCSYAATPVGGGPGGDVTGVGNGALDNSEGVGGNGWVAPINATIGQCFVVCINNYAGGSSTFDITFGGTAGLDCAILPVELLSLSCNALTDGIEINWRCASELNNSHFILERTSDGVNFEYISRIEGAGSTSQPTSYKYVDLTAPSGTSYYRLVQVDYNGTETKYGPIACDYNPGAPALMEVIDMSGQIIFSGETQNYLHTMQNGNYIPGLYVVVLTRGSTRQTIKYAVTGEMVIPD